MTLHHRRLAESRCDGRAFLSLRRCVLGWRHSGLHGWDRRIGLRCMSLHFVDDVRLPCLRHRWHAGEHAYPVGEITYTWRTP